MKSRRSVVTVMIGTIAGAMVGFMVQEKAMRRHREDMRQLWADMVDEERVKLRIENEKSQQYIAAIEPFCCTSIVIDQNMIREKATPKECNYVYLSLVIGVVLLIVDVTELTVTNIERRPRLTPQAWRQNLNMGHVVSFYIFLIGFVYSKEARIPHMVKLAWVSCGINLIAFVIRQSYDLLYMDYHPTEYV